MGTLHPLRRKTTAKDNYYLRVVASQAKREIKQSKRVILSLGYAMPQGIPVTLWLGNEGEIPEVSTTGWLPPAKAVIAAYQRWQQTYQQIFAGGVSSPSRLSAPAVQVTNVSYQETIERCCYAETVLIRCLNQWLNSDLFRPVRETLLAHCHPSEIIRLILQTDNLLLQKLPLHRWDWFDRYPQAELVLSSAVSDGSSKHFSGMPRGMEPLNVLVILGESHDLDTDTDLALLESLPHAAVTCLREPTRSQLTETLWDHPWDIILFAGHSDEDGHQPKLRLSADESLSLRELKYGLKKAIAQNLKLLILNTCDSLSLVKSLNNDLCLPATIAMRSPVPDPVAQTFLRYFLTAFSQGQSLPQAVREAREKLQGIEHQFPFASWIPVLHQTL